MTFKKHTVKGLSNAVNYIVSKKHFIALAGRRVYVLNNDLEIINSITNLKSVYYGEVSNDQKKMLLVSNSNIFYVYDLVNQKLMFDYTVKAPYNYNLEGCGTWCFDGKKILICGCNRKTLRPCLMFFDISKKAIVKKINLEEYTHVILKKLNNLNCYAIIGHKLGDAENAYIMYFKDEIILEQKIYGFDDIVSDFEYNDFLQKYILYGESYSMICDYYGNQQKNLNIKYISKNKTKIFEALTDKVTIENKEIFINKILEFFNNSNEFEIINKILVSSNNDNIYIATSERILVYNVLSKTIDYDCKVPFGVRNIVELNNSIAIAIWNGMFFLKKQSSNPQCKNTH